MDLVPVRSPGRTPSNRPCPGGPRTSRRRPPRPSRRSTGTSSTRRGGPALSRQGRRPSPTVVDGTSGPSPSGTGPGPDPSQVSTSGDGTDGRRGWEGGVSYDRCWVIPQTESGSTPGTLPVSTHLLPHTRRCPTPPRRSRRVQPRKDDCHTCLIRELFMNILLTQVLSHLLTSLFLPFFLFTYLLTCLFVYSLSYSITCLVTYLLT